MINPITTGAFIKEQRKKLDLSQQKLAEMLCVEPQTVSKWERGLGMPDYDNIERLKEIFGCSLSDILEPREEEKNEELPFVATPAAEPQQTNLPVLMEIIGKDDKQKKTSSFSQLFGFLSKKKMRANIERLFGYEYANTYNEKFLFRNLLHRRTRADYDTTLSQGMFRDRVNHSTLGIEAPWLYARLFLFLLICSGIALFSALLFGSVISFVILGGLCAVVPLMMFLFESNFARNMTVFDVGKLFLIGGLSSILLTFILNIFLPQGPVVSTVLFAPIIEEIAKAAIVVFFVARIKPRNMLTGLLIGFAVGAGFGFFESVEYAFSSYISVFYTEVESGTEIIGFFSNLSAIKTILLRTFCSFFSGHHYLTGIFGAAYVLFKKDTGFSAKELFQPRVMLALAFSMILHALWNASTLITVPFLPLLLQIPVAILSVGSIILLINVGISQTKAIGIWEDYQAEHQDEQAISEPQPVKFG